MEIALNLEEQWGKFAPRPAVFGRLQCMAELGWEGARGGERGGEWGVGRKGWGGEGEVVKQLGQSVASI
jgi:hypothetical protein